MELSRQSALFDNFQGVLDKYLPFSIRFKYNHAKGWIFMKKVLLGFILGIIVAFGVCGYANNVMKATPATFPILVNGEEFKSNDKPAVTIDGSTYLPLRSMGNALNVPVEWNTKLKRVEVGIPKTEAKSEPVPKTEIKSEDIFKIVKCSIKSSSLKIKETADDPVIVKGSKYYLKPNVLVDYMTQGDNGKYYLKLPGKDPVLYQEDGKVTEYAIKYANRTYLDIDAFKIKCSLDGDIFQIEI